MGGGSGRPREYAVIGLGRFGSSLALRLIELGHSVLGIDRDREIVQRLADDLTQTAVLDASDEVALQDVGITAFDAVIVAIGADFESNLMATTALKGLAVPLVIAKALSDRQRTILLRVGADRVILPEIEAGQRLADELGGAPGG
jgi:trk system potassium uptake protein TrkA